MFSLSEGIAAGRTVMKDVTIPSDSQGDMADRRRLDDVIEFARSNQRVCPLPDSWDQLWRLLPKTNTEAPPAPLILGDWSLPARSKMNRLREHLEYADRHGVLSEVDAFLQSLSESDWMHLQ